MNWFYESGGQQQGPVSDADLDRLIAEGKINAGTLVWREGQDNWLPLREARPAAVAPVTTGIPSPDLSGLPGDDSIHCDSCKKLTPRSNIVQIGGRNVCVACKPAILQRLQQGADLSTIGEIRTGPPWEHRRQLGLVKTAWDTVRQVLTDPNMTFSAMNRDGGIASPLLYFLFVAGAGWSVNIIFSLAIESLGLFASHLQSEKTVTDFAAFAVSVGAAVVLLPIALTICSFIAAGVLHLSLMICGGAKQTFETTYRTYCYAFGSAGLLQAVPICGGLVSLIWGIIACSIGLARTHETSTGRAVAAVLAPFVLCFGVLIAFSIMMIYGLSAIHMRT